MIDEHQVLNRNINIKKKKFEWQEFCNFSPYQIYTLLCLNREIIKELERKIFPKSLSFINMENKEEFENIKEEDILSDENENENENEDKN